MILVCKFLGLRDDELAIYDETRTKDGSKQDNRYAEGPSRQQ